MQATPRNLAALMFAATVSTAYGHGTVETASPKNGSTLNASPSEIRLKFTERLEPTFTSVKLFDSSGRELPTTGKARVEDGKTVVLPLPVLAPGAYKARWTTVGHDGHRVQGELNFTVK